VLRGVAGATCDELNCRSPFVEDQPMSSAGATAASTRPIIYLGLDVHKESIDVTPNSVPGIMSVRWLG